MLLYLGKSRKDTTIDELEAELLDDADLLDVDENIDDDDDLFNDLWKKSLKRFIFQTIQNLFNFSMTVTS